VTHALFEPITLRGLEVRNRIWVSPMCQYSVERQDGVPTTWHLVHLGSFARGGAGAVITEATAVLPEGRITAQDLGIWNDEQREAFRPVVDFIHAQGAMAGVQLAHAGRKASVYRTWATEHGTVPAAEGGWPTVAPSAVAFGAYDQPTALDVEGVHAATTPASTSSRSTRRTGTCCTSSSRRSATPARTSTADRLRTGHAPSSRSSTPCVPRSATRCP
jgi:2,4-dienoyl-CoA reductase-like NADH-dependent reductase (Old Yellow Enzyme family)